MDQRGSCEVIDVVHGAHDPRADPGVADARGGPRRDAVLGMHEREAVPERTQAFLERIDRVEDPLLEGVGVRRGGYDGERDGRGAEEARSRLAEGHDVDEHSCGGERLGKREGVHHATARLGGVRHECDLCGTHGILATSAGSRFAIAAAASEARAAVSVTMQPAFRRVSR